MWIQTVKTAASGSPVLHERGEWKSRLAGEQPDPADLAWQIKPQRLREVLRDTKITGPTATGAAPRSASWSWSWGWSSSAAIPPGCSSWPCSCTRTSRSKWRMTARRRGYALLQDEAPAPVKAPPVRLARKMRMEDALQRMGLSCMAQIESNVPGVLVQSPHPAADAPCSTRT